MKSFLFSAIAIILISVATTNVANAMAEPLPQATLLSAAFAADPTQPVVVAVDPSPSVAPTVAPAPEIPVADFLSQVLDAVKGFGGLPWVAKIAALITLILSSMKVSFLRQLVWDKIGALKPWLAPGLGLLAGILALGKGINLASAIAYISAGAGAIIFHELLDSLKAAPGLGVGIQGFINLLMSWFGAKKEASKPA